MGDMLVLERGALVRTSDAVPFPSCRVPPRKTTPLASDAL